MDLALRQIPVAYDPTATVRPDRRSTGSSVHGLTIRQIGVPLDKSRHLHLNRLCQKTPRAKAIKKAPRNPFFRLNLANACHALGDLDKAAAAKPRGAIVTRGGYRHRARRAPSAGVAQLVERVICNHEVAGSNPAAGTMVLKAFRFGPIGTPPPPHFQRRITP